MAVASDAKVIAKKLVVRFRQLDASGELARDAQKVAKAINDLRKERRLTWAQRHRRATI